MRRGRRRSKPSSRRYKKNREKKRAAFTEEHAALQEEHSAARRSVAECELTEEQLRRDKAELAEERDLLSAERDDEQAHFATERAALQEEHSAARRSVAECELTSQRELLKAEVYVAAAAAGRDSLREQLEDQRRDLLNAGDRAVQSCRDDLELRLEQSTQQVVALRHELAEHAQWQQQESFNVDESFDFPGVVPTHAQQSTAPGP